MAQGNTHKGMIDPDDAAMLLIDHQSGLFQTVKDMPMPELRANVTTRVLPMLLRMEEALTLAAAE